MLRSHKHSRPGRSGGRVTFLIATLLVAQRKKVAKFAW
jgi:hypothetical protein